ncbi:MAG: thioredoxin domain-containing protein, partial [Flavobacteriales bacterium]
MNRLAAETSPYLLQHKDNPVHWYAWGDEAWEIARRENKPVLVSIGYSVCHWCHVMEHEVFEDFECAELMNMHFICIKVDREERPDVDSWFMDAVHLMGSQGGWPLNVFTLPDGRPIYGGTYFPKNKWISLLMNLRNVFQADHQRVEEYAQQLDEAMRAINLPDASKSTELSLDAIHGLIDNWSKYWDAEWGGNRKAPKFPMPNNWELLLNYAVFFKNENALRHVNDTLRKMAFGGLYDQLAGGFARYSVDVEWKVPHFEKMLYDNAQLVSLYAQAYRATGDNLFKRVAEETLSFVM